MEQNSKENPVISFKPGDTIAEYEPIMQCLLRSTLGSYCSNCFAEKPNLTCHCGQMKYCNEVCHVQDWNNGHRIECLMLKSERFREHYISCKHSYVVLLVRLYSMRIMKPMTCRMDIDMFDGTCKRNLRSMPCRYGSDTTKAALLAESEKMGELINEANPEESPIHHQEIFDMLGVIHANKVPLVNDKEWILIGFGLYIEIGYFPHSCIKPTAVFINNGTKLQVRAIAPISAGTLPTVSYLKKTYARTVRKDLLKSFYCISECSCMLCNAKYSEKVVKYDRLRFLLTKMQGMQARNLEKTEWPDVYEVHQELLKRYRKICNEYDLCVTQLFRVTLEIGLKMDVDETSLEKLALEVEKHMRVTYGTEHPFYKISERSFGRFVEVPVKRKLEGFW